MADVDNPYKAAVSPSQTVPAYDIVNDYDWTSSPAGSDLRKETPCAYIRAYKMEFSQLQQFIDGFINIATAETKAKKLGADPGLQFYKDLYSSSKVMADINFPFFSDNIRGFRSEYEDTFSAISQRGSQFLFGEGINNLGNAAIGSIGGAIAGARELGNLGGNGISEAVAGGANAVGQFAGRGFEKLTGLKMPGFQTVGAPGSFIETPKFYQYSDTDEGVEIAFVLSNTLNDFRSNKGFRQNIKFIKEFTMMNRPYREGAIAMTFPAIYHIEIPGLRYIEWAYLENFGIELMGTRRRIGKDIIPEAYMCKFIFKSLTIEAANFVEQTNQVEAFDEGDSSYVALRRQSDTAAETRQAAEREEQRKRKEAAARQEEIEQTRKNKEVKKQLEKETSAEETPSGYRNDPNAGSTVLPEPPTGPITQQERNAARRQAAEGASDETLDQVAEYNRNLLQQSIDARNDTKNLDAAIQRGLITREQATFQSEIELQTAASDAYSRGLPVESFNPRLTQEEKNRLITGPRITSVNAGDSLESYTEKYVKYHNDKTTSAIRLAIESEKSFSNQEGVSEFNTVPVFLQRPE